MTDMTKLKNPSYIRSNSQKETGNTFDPEAALIAEGLASAEFSADIDAALNEALKDTFPASDPISSLRAA
jgi:hypothetical protein